MGFEAHMVNRVLSRIFGRFLYGTSKRYFTLTLLLAAIYAGFGLWFLKTRTIWSPLLVLVVIGVIAIAAFLYYGARQATMTRLVDEQTFRAEAEQQIVKELQTALLQRAIPTVPNVSINATYLPANLAELVGGDWYDVFEVSPDQVMFSIGDVVGHGMNAAVTMNQARQAIVAAALRESDPGAILERANAMLRLREDQFVTATCGYVDTTSMGVAYACAGHPPAILVRKDAPAELLECAGVPLGVLRDAEYTTCRIRASYESLLVLYTDGLVEYNREILAGLQRLQQVARLVALEAYDNPAEAIQDAIFGEYAPVDDVAILTVSFRKTSRAAIRGAGLRHRSGR